MLASNFPFSGTIFGRIRFQRVFYLHNLGCRLSWVSHSRVILYNEQSQSIICLLSGVASHPLCTSTRILLLAPFLLSQKFVESKLLKVLSLASMPAIMGCVCRRCPSLRIWTASLTSLILVDFGTRSVSALTSQSSKWVDSFDQLAWVAG